MKKEIFDSLMTAYGWIPKGNAPMDLLASENPKIDFTGIETAYKYSHMAGFTICVDDAEINMVSDSVFEEWLEQASEPYVKSRVCGFCTGRRYKTFEGEYIEVECDRMDWMGLRLQIEQLTKRDSYQLKERGRIFNWRKFKFKYKAIFFKPKPI